MSVTPPSSNKPWQQDKVYIVNANGTYRAQPPTKVVQAGQDVTWDGLKKVLVLADNAQLTNYRYSNNNTVVTATVVAEPGAAFYYDMTCAGCPVEGNSPPVIIVE